MYKQQFDYAESYYFLVRCGNHHKTAKLRITSLLNLGTKLAIKSRKSPEIVGNVLKSIFCRLEDKNCLVRLQDLGYSIYTKQRKLKSFNSIISEIRKVGPHPKLVRLLGIRNWDIIMFLF